MADSGDAKPTPSADQFVSDEPRLAEHETKLVTDPSGTEADKTEPSEERPSFTETLSNAAASAGGQASATASGVKDSVFSMFGGGEKKEKKAGAEDEGNDEPSGSSKAKKDDEDDVRTAHQTIRMGW